MTETSPTLTRAEAARLNGAKSRGPRTPEGKARSARNALKHGLTAQAFALAPGEDGAAFQELLDRLVARYRPQDEIAAHLVQRLASVMWRQQRADRLEAEVLEQRDYAGSNLHAPMVWDAARFSAVQRHQARLDRTLFRLLDELERHAPAMEEVQNEPKAAPAAAVPDLPASRTLRTVEGRVGAPERTRTSDLKLRRLALYPTELRARAGLL